MPLRDSILMAEPIRLAASNDGEEQRLPRNVEAEAAFLGALLIDNRILEDVSIKLRPEHFFEPLHGRIFDQILRLIDRNMLVTPPPRPPTAHADYACWNYILLAMILERCTGSSFPDFCEKEIFQPLGMADSRLGQSPPTGGQERLAQTMGTDAPGQISDFVAARIYRDGGSRLMLAATETEGGCAARFDVALRMS